ncbi:MAG: type II secretion system F family protein [Rubripirellula sp.]|nr:type II secretion system F family protein [Rubripirellula sp.]
MPRLNDQQLADLLDEVGSAIEHSIPIPQALVRVAEQQHGSPAMVARTLLRSLEQGVSLKASFQALKLADDDQITAAIQATTQTGTPDLLYRFAETLRSRHAAKHTITLNWFYPCILTVLAYILFVNSLAPLVRDNQNLIAQWPDAVVRASIWIENGWWLPPVITTAIFAAAFLLVRQRQRLPSTVSRSLFYSTLASQLDSKVPESQAIHTAALMAGDVELSQTENATFTTPRLLQLLGPDSKQYLIQATDARETAASETPASQDKRLRTISRRAHLRHLAFATEQKTRQREKLMHQFLPNTVSFVLGFIFIFSTASLFIAPIYRQVIQW